MGAVAYQLMRQQGRLMERMDRIDLRLAAAERTVLPLVPAEHADHAHATVTGFPVGTELPSFELPDFTGRMRGPADFRGNRLLLVHWSPGCGFCETIADELASLQEPLQRRD